MARIFGIVPAAGSGTRMQAERSKVLLPLQGEAVVARTLRLLSAKVQFEVIIIPSAKSDLEAVSEALKPLDVVHVVIQGGETRQHSVSLALEALITRCAPEATDLVLVHDAARCFVSPELVERCVAEATRIGAVTAALPVVDTLVRVDSLGRTTDQLDRNQVWAVQTPQVFRFDLFKRAHAQGAPGATDDASLVAAFHPVTVVEGTLENLKLTTPADYTFATHFLL